MYSFSEEFLKWGKANTLCFFENGNPIYITAIGSRTIPTQRSVIARLPYGSLDGGRSDDSLSKAILGNETNVKVQYSLFTKFIFNNYSKSAC